MADPPPVVVVTVSGCGSRDLLHYPFQRRVVVFSFNTTLPPYLLWFSLPLPSPPILSLPSDGLVVSLVVLPARSGRRSIIFKCRVRDCGFTFTEHNFLFFNSLLVQLCFYRTRFTVCVINYQLFPPRNLYGCFLYQNMYKYYVFL